MKKSNHFLAAAVMLFTSALAIVGQKLNDVLFGYMATRGLILGMAQLTPAQARVIDPVLSSIAQGYKNSEMVSQFLFPTVPVS